MFRVRKDKIQSALEWLIQYNPLYENVILCEETLRFYERNPTFTIDHVVESNEEESRGNSDQDEIQSEFVESSADDFQGMFVPSRTGTELRDGVANIVAPSLRGPINDLDPIPSFFALSYPTLFPSGIGDFTSMKHIPKSIGYSSWVNHLMKYEDGRFQCHSHFCFSVWNSQMKKKSVTVGGVYLKNSVDMDHPPSVNDMVTMLQDETDRCRISRTLCHYMSSIPSTPSFWFSKCQEMTAAIDFVHHLPLFFYTFSFADLYDFSLHSVLGTQSKNERWSRIQSNLFPTMEFFLIKWQSFRDEFFFKLLNVHDYYERYEFQQRGMPHVHGIAWVNFPRISELLEISQESIGNEETSPALSIIQQWVNSKLKLGAMVPDPDLSEDDYLQHCLSQDITSSDSQVGSSLQTTTLALTCMNHNCGSKCQKNSKCRYDFPKPSQKMERLSRMSME